MAQDPQYDFSGLEDTSYDFSGLESLPDNAPPARSRGAGPNAEPQARTRPIYEAPYKPIGKPQFNVKPTVTDIGIDLLKGVTHIPEAAVGLADIPTFGYAGKVLNYLGFRPDEARNILSSFQSEELQAARAQFGLEQGMGNKLSVLSQNPILAMSAAAESLPSMLGGAAVGRKAAQLIPKLGSLGGGAVGEGIVGTGMAAEGIRQQTPDKLLTAPQIGAAVGTGALTTLFGVAGGKIAQKFGFADVDTLLTAAKANPNLAKNFTQEVLQIAAAGANEGLLEELPQGIQEQVLQNLALGRPAGEGVSEAAIMSLATGTMMGSAAQTYSTIRPGPRPTLDALSQQNLPLEGGYQQPRLPPSGPSGGAPDLTTPVGKQQNLLFENAPPTQEGQEPLPFDINSNQNMTIPIAATGTRFPSVTLHPGPTQAQQIERMKAAGYRVAESTEKGVRMVPQDAPTPQATPIQNFTKDDNPPPNTIVVDDIGPGWEGYGENGETIRNMYETIESGSEGIPEKSHGMWTSEAEAEAKRQGKTIVMKSELPDAPTQVEQPITEPIPEATTEEALPESFGPAAYAGPERRTGPRRGIEFRGQTITPDTPIDAMQDISGAMRAMEQEDPSIARKAEEMRKKANEAPRKKGGRPPRRQAFTQPFKGGTPVTETGEKVEVSTATPEDLEAKKKQTATDWFEVRKTARQKGINIAGITNLAEAQKRVGIAPTMTERLKGELGTMNIEGEAPKKPKIADEITRVAVHGLGKPKGFKAWRKRNKTVKGMLRAGFQPTGYKDADGNPIFEKPSEKSLSRFREAWNLPRGLMSVDLPFFTSAAIRQGLPLIGPNFSGWVKAWKNSMRAYTSEVAYANVMNEIGRSPLMQRGRDKKGQQTPSYAEMVDLKLTDVSNMTKREESIRSKWAERFLVARIPGTQFEVGWGKHVAMSNRAYTAFMNTLRVSALEKFTKMAKQDSLLHRATGGKFGTAGRDPMTDLEYGKQIADMINTLSGRGKLELELTPDTRGTKQRIYSAEGAAKNLVDAFFSPRLIASRVKMLNPNTYISADPFTRKQYLKGMASAIGGWWTFAALASMLTGGEVGEDPNSANFGKVRVGNTRFDFGGGFQQFLVLFSRLRPSWFKIPGSVTAPAWEDPGGGLFTDSQDDTVIPLGTGFRGLERDELTYNFWRSKLHPSAAFAWDIFRASEKHPFPVMDRTMQLAIPMMAGDLADVVNSDPWLIPSVIGVGSIGGGASTYEGGKSTPSITPVIDRLTGLNLTESDLVLGQPQEN